MAPRKKVNVAHDDNEIVEQDKRSKKGVKDPQGTGKMTSAALDHISDEDSQGVESLETTQTTRSKRGRTHMDKLAIQRAQGVKQEINFNDLGQPVGKHAAELQSFLGVLAREKVNITYASWKQVPAEVKNLIWESVNLIYKVDPKWRTGCLSSANAKWRQYKTHLTKEFIWGNRNNPKALNNPPAGHYISQEDWSSFVISRMSEDFMKMSDKQRERSKANIYPHRLSRKGYAGLAEDISSELCEDDEINRAILWKKGRANKEGEFKCDELKQTIQRIDDYIVQKKEGKLSFSKPYEDILTKALDSGEHGGRVRGVGGHITPTMFFKVGRGGKQVDKEVLGEQQKELKEAKDLISAQGALISKQGALISEQGERIEKLEAMMQRRALEFENDEKGSCSVKLQPLTKQPEVEIEQNIGNDEDFDDADVKLLDKDVALQGKAVTLSLESNNTVVAYGTIVSVNGPGNFIDSEPLPINCMRVAIDQAIDESAPLPVQIPSTCQSVADAVGNHVAWPVHLISMRDEKPRKKKVGDTKKKFKLQLSSMPRPLYILYSYFERLDNGENVLVTLDHDVFGNDCIAYVHLEDITPFSQLKPTSGTCIIVYMWHLYRKMKEEILLQNFRFVDPFPIGHVPSTNPSHKPESLNKRARYLADRLKGTLVSQLVVVPCNIGFHWILTVIDVDKEIIYLLDPLSHRICDGDWKYVVDMALKMYNAEKGRKGKKQPTWEVVKAPLQPDGDQCGFYVMRYMRDIIENIGTIDRVSLRPMFANLKYSRKEIDEVRCEWAECLLDYI